MRFSELGLSPALIEALAGLSILEPRPVQAMALPPALAGRDLLVLAATGSGKTVAFAAPILDSIVRAEASCPPQPDQGQRSSEARGRAPGQGGAPLSALVLVPTRELAVQVASVFEAIGSRLGLARKPRIRLAHGGVSINPQMLSLRAGAEVLVATPGRLLDLARHGALRLGQLRWLVLDEADRLLAEGFSDELAGILALLPSGRQSLLFSATFTPEAASVLGPLLREPLRLGEEAAPQGGEIIHKAFSVANDEKGPSLRRLIREGGWDRVLVFASSNRRADNVARKLNNNGIAAAALHGDLSQAARSTGLADFKTGRIRALVASDLASRGLDIEGLPCVINYELPRSALDYVHRAGRTGRAGRDGLVISLVSPDEEAMLRLVRKRSGFQIPLEALPPGGAD